MRSILNNPYRTVGLLIGATAPEQRRQLTRLQRYLEAEQEPEDDFSFPVLGKIERTIDSVNEAASKLNLDSDKMNAALFWFYKGNSITDEPALDAIREGNVSEAFNIWSKLTIGGEVTQRNASAYNNLGTLCLSAITKENTPEQGILLKLKFLESDYVKDVQALATDETYKITKKELQLLFLNQVQAELVNTGVITTNKFLAIINKQSFAAREDFLKGFVQKPIEQIEKQVADCKLKRKEKVQAITAGRTLYQQTVDNLSQLKSILGASNPKYASISDKVSEEILQCGIEYFRFVENSTAADPGQPAMELYQKAKSLAVGNIAVQWCQEKIADLQQWIDEKPERDRLARVKNDLEALKKLIESCETQPDTVANAKILLVNAGKYLPRVKHELGANDELYLGISTMIASEAQGMCVAEINMLQKHFPTITDRAKKLEMILVLSNEADEAMDVSNSILAMDLRKDFRERAMQNKNSLLKLRGQLPAAPGSRPPNGGTTGGGGGGCYIATMAYGDYDHPQVLELRKFRDDVLAGSVAGRLFIRSYYFISPKLVSLLKDQAGINALIRKLLNQFIKLLK